MKTLVLIAHNVRSAHNVGSLLRTAEGLGISRVYLTGYTPYPKQKNDSRLPHQALNTHNKITKTALGAEAIIDNEHVKNINKLILKLRDEGFVICALEQSKQSKKLPQYKSADKIALIVGREVEGIEPEVLKVVDVILEIPMFGQKESFNVAQAAAMAMYHLKFI